MKLNLMKSTLKFYSSIFLIHNLTTKIRKFDITVLLSDPIQVLSLVSVMSFVEKIQVQNCASHLVDMFL